MTDSSCQALLPAFTGTDRFELLTRLGEGGSGVVYAAFDRQRQARVALKTLRALDPDSLLRFKREFRALEGLRHANLVELGELFETEGFWFFTMELVEGTDWLSYVRPEGRCNLARLRWALAQVVDALATLHGSGKVHRDLKPSNIRVETGGRVVLLDFGLVVDLWQETPPTQESMIVGTAAYMAPEQASGRRVGPEADCYALGVLLFEALTGALPFRGEPLQLLLRKQHEPAPAPATLAPEAPDDLCALSSALLEREAGRRPSALSLCTQLRVSERPGATSASGLLSERSSQRGGPFVGRARELSRLAAAFERARRGELATAYLQGDSGVGKSALVREFTGQLTIAQPGVVVLTGRCYEREAVPYKAFDGLVDALSLFLRELPADECAALLPAHPEVLPQVFPILGLVPSIAEAPLRSRGSQHSPAGPDGGQLRQQAFASLKELLARLAEHRPLVMLLEDLQWADPESLDLLRALVRPPEPPSLLLIATARGDAECPKAVRAAARAMLAAGGDHRLQIAGLPPQEAAQLATLLLGGPAGAESIARETEGHPLFIDVLVRYSQQARSTGASLDEALRFHVEQLAEDAAQVLALVATAGAPLPREVASQASGLSPELFARQLGLLRMTRLVRSLSSRGRDALVPYHDRIRAATLGRLDTERRAELHRALARAFEAMPEKDVLALALHWEEGGEPRLAARYAELGGDRMVQALAFERAAGLYTQALACYPGGDRLGTLHVKRGDALACAGRGVDAAEAFLAALDAPPAPLDASELERRAAFLLMVGGHTQQGRVLSDRLLASIGVRLPADTRTARARLRWQRLRLSLRGLGYTLRDPDEVPLEQLRTIDILRSVARGLVLVDGVAASELMTRALRAALEAGEPGRIALSLADEAALCRYGSSTPEVRAEPLLRMAEDLAAGTEDAAVQARPRLVRGSLRFWAGHFREALVDLDWSERWLRERCRGELHEIAQLHDTMGAAYWLSGEIGALREALPEWLQDARARGDVQAETGLLLTVGVLPALLDDDPTRAASLLDDALARSGPGHELRAAFKLQSLSLLATYVGAADAWQRVTARWARPRSVRMWEIPLLRDVGLAARGRAALASAVRDPRRREPLLLDAQRCARHLAHSGLPAGRALGLDIAAGWALALGRTAEACRTLECARQAHQRAGLPLLQQASSHRLAALTGDGSGQARAGDWLASRGVREPGKLVAMLHPVR